MTGIYDMAMQGLQITDQGRERKKQRTLAELVGKAYQSEGPERQQYIGQAIGMDPDAGFAAQGHFRQMDEDMRSQVARHAQVFTSLPDEQKAAMYPQLAAEVRKVTGVNVPDVYDAKFLPMIQRLGGVSAGEGYTLGPGARRFDANNQLVAESPFAPANLQLASVATGDGGTQQMQYNPRSGALSPLLGGGAQGVQDLIRNLAGQYDGQITSMVRTPEHNREVGGVPNSQHIRGTAGDVVIRDPQMRKAYMEAAKGMGLSVIDEGDHLHTQLPRGAQVAQAGPLGYTPPKRESDRQAPAGYRWGPDGNLQVIPGGPADKGSNATTGGVNAQKLHQANSTKLAQFDAADRAIERLERASQSIAGNKVFDGGPLDQYALQYSQQGQELEQASAAMLPILTALTRVPGMGSQSDFEAKLNQLQMPSAKFSPEVNANALKALREYMRGLRQAVQGTRPPEQSGSDIDALLDKYK